MSNLHYRSILQPTNRGNLTSWYPHAPRVRSTSTDCSAYRTKPLATLPRKCPGLDRLPATIRSYDPSWATFRIASGTEPRSTNTTSWLIPCSSNLPIHAVNTADRWVPCDSTSSKGIREGCPASLRTDERYDAAVGGITCSKTQLCTGGSGQSAPPHLPQHHHPPPHMPGFGETLIDAPYASAPRSARAEPIAAPSGLSPLWIRRHGPGRRRSPACPLASLPDNVADTSSAYPTRGTAFGRGSRSTTSWQASSITCLLCATSSRSLTADQ